MRKPLHGNRLSRWLLLVLTVLLSSSAAWSQSTANYAFNTTTTGSLVDMSTGTTDALATGTYRDDVASAVQPIGFAFAFMGTPYTQFSVNSNGQLRLGATAVAGTAAAPAAGAAILAPISGDNALQAAGKVVYKVVAGTNRSLVVEWTGLRIPYAGDPAAGTPTQVQVVLEENTGKVEYRYGTVYNNSTSTTRSIFISAGTAAGKIGVVKTFTATPTYDATVTSATTSALPDNAAVTGLSSTADGARTTFTFTPTAAAPAAPSVALSAVTQTALSVDITDNSTNEYSFGVFRSTDNVTFTLVGAVTSAATAGTGATVSLPQAGLTAATQYYYRVVAYSEGLGSAAATATATTLAAVPICGTKTVGPAAGADYPTLTAAFAALTNNGVCGPLVFELQAAYVSTAETFPLVYSYAGGTATNTVTVRPAAGATGLSITGTGATAALNIVGGKYLILDGRPGGSGSTVSGAATSTDLTIASTSTSGIPLQFTSDATFNTVQHCQIKGVGTGDSASPDVNFTGTVTTAGNSDNTLQYCNIGDGATTPVTLVYSGNALNSRNSLLNNNLFNNYGTGSTYGIYLNQAGTGWAIIGNSLYQTANRVNVSGTMYGMYVAGGNHAIANNFIGGSAPSAGGTPLTVTTTGAGAYAAYRFVGIYLTASGTATSVQGNTVANITWASSSGASTTYGILSGIYVTAGDANIGTTTGNTIGTASGPISVTTSTTGGYSFGISTASSGTVSLVGNTIGNLTGVGSTASIASNVAGILASTGAANTISRNKIYNLAAGSGGGNLSTGLWLTGGTLNTVSNNLIGDLRAATSTSLVAVSGILVSSGTTNLYYNTVSLAATSSGATFGTSGIYLNSTSAVLDLRNNIVVNKSTAAGTGGYTAALRRISGTAGTVPVNLAATTNYNLYYAGAPSATNLLYVEGTTTATNAQQTLADYKAFVATRESNSVTEDVPFVSTTGTAATFLHVSTTVPTQVESGGTPISGITADVDGDTRSATTPDIGADEGTFQPLDIQPPLITYTALASSASTTSRTLTATITDASGVATGANGPRLFFRKGTTGTYTSVLATAGPGGSYTFTLDYSLLGGVVVGDVIQYYVAAQDAAAPANSGTNPAGGTYATAPATPNSFTILGALSGNYYVGTSAHTPAATYATLTAAVADYNSKGLTGAVNFILIDSDYSTAETFPITLNANGDASAANTLTIKPEAGVTAAIAGSVATGAVLKLNGADYVTLDGSNNGSTSRNLTITNTSATGTGNAVLWLAAASATDGATANTVKNTFITGNSSTGFPQFTVFVGGGGAGIAAPTTSTPAANSGNTFSNNVITKGFYGLFVYGVSATVLDQGNTFTGNQLGQSASGTGFGLEGMRAVFQQNLTIQANEIQGVISAAAASHFGLNLSTLKNALIDRNAIHDVQSNSATSGYVGYGMSLASTAFATSTNASANTVSNNIIYNISAPLAATSSNPNVLGIANGGGYGDRVVFNTILLNGAQTAGTGYSAAISNGDAQYSAASAALDVRNNIIALTANVTTAAKYFGFYTSASSVAGSTLDYNNYYLAGSGSATFAVGNLNGTSLASSATLAAWQTATGQEANSRSVDPQFAQTAAVPFNLTPGNAALNNVGTPISGVTTDYTGATRGALPDIGAIEFTPLTNDLAPLALVAPATTSTCYGTAEPVSVSIRNAGTSPLNFAANAATITVVVTLPGGGTQTLAATVNTGTLASNATQTVTLPTTLNMSTVGTYSFAITATVAGDGNPANDLLVPTPTRTVAAPVAGTLAPASSTICVSGTATLTLTGAANGTIQFQSSPDNVTFTDIAGATSATYTTPVLTSTTYFRAQVRCNTGTATSNVSTLTVNNPQVATTNSPVTICAGSTATLTATAAASSSVRFFSAATGGTALATAGTYTTPALTASTTYYAEAFTGATENVGKATSSQTDGGYTGGNTGLVFTAAGPVTIQAATVYNALATAGSMSVELRDNAGALIATAGPFTIAAGSTSTLVPTVLTLNLAVPAAGTYRLVTAASPTPPTLYRDFTTGNNFPFTSPSGQVAITGGLLSGSASTTYYFFYNVAVSTECVGATRTPIQVNVTQPATASFPAATASTCGTSPYQLAGTVSGSATTGTYTSSGTGTFSPNATTLNATYTPSAADVAAGSVTITLTSAASAPCAATTATLALSIGRPAVATFSYPATGGNCAGSTGTVVPTLGTGTTAGAFTVSPATGLTINATTGVVNLATSTAGTYTVTNTVAASGGCAAATATATITVNPTPARPVLTVTYNGTTTTLTSSAATGNQFYFNGVAIPGATGQTYVVNGSVTTYGSYTVVATNSFGCSSLPSVPTVVTTAKSGIAGASLLVYPNPTPDGQVTLELSGFRSTTQLTVLDALGRVVSSKTLPATGGVITHSLDLSRLASGVYMLRLTNADGVETRRLTRE